MSREMVKWRRYINHNKQKQLWDLTFVTFDNVGNKITRSRIQLFLLILVSFYQEIDKAKYVRTGSWNCKRRGVIAKTSRSGECSMQY
jgi:hypothetical protein